MFFLHLIKSIQKSHTNLINNSINHIRNSQTQTSKILKICKKSIFRHAPFLNKTIKGSTTIETSIALPIFIFFVMNLLSFFDIMRLQMEMDAALHQTARELAVYGYAVKDEKDIPQLAQLIGSIAFSEVYVRKQVKDYIGDEHLKKLNIDNGSKGIYYGLSRIMDEDKIELAATYEISPFVPYIGFQKFWTSNHCIIRAFTGYDNTKNEKDNTNEEMVYITETGSAYHRDRNCTHLRLSISLIEKALISSKRNDYGEKYTACDKCGKNTGNKVYITNNGNSYHGKLECSGLKRTIQAVPISEVGNRTPCQRCGG